MRSLTLALALLFVLPAAAAHARDATITSFDGTQIVLSFHPSPAGGKAPTILQGHGWAGSRETNPEAGSDEVIGNVGVGALRRAGFNVLTWDSRGFGNSGGTVTVDAPDREARDVMALIDWLAQQPEAQLDKAGDPRVGMTGVSYAGGIELTTAALDKRIDAIAPIIAWHSLTSSLYKEETVKGGWATGLTTVGIPASKGRLDPHVLSAFTSGATTGKLSDEDRAWFASRGPGDLVKQITVPTFLVQGTADTLFTLKGAITNAEILKANGVPTKMLWFCAGHGVCLTGAGPNPKVTVDGRRVKVHKGRATIDLRGKLVALGVPLASALDRLERLLAGVPAVHPHDLPLGRLVDREEVRDLVAERHREVVELLHV